MLMNFSPANTRNDNPYISQDETDILLEIDRIDGVKHKITESERRFANATICKSELL